MAAARPSPKKDNRIIHSLDKGLVVLEVLEKADRPLSLNEIFQQLGWERATIHRLLETLTRRGYVLRHADTKRYSLGLRILSLYTALRTEIDVQAVARPILQKLTAAFGESSHVAIPIGNTMLFIDWVHGPGAVTIASQVAEQVPMHCTAIGKCFLAFDRRVDLTTRFPDGLDVRTDKSLPTVAALEGNLRRAKKRGFATDNEEYLKDVRCVAAPVFSDTDMVVAAIGISAPRFRTPLGKLEEIGEQLVTYAGEVSQAFGFSASPDPAS